MNRSRLYTTIAALVLGAAIAMGAKSTAPQAFYDGLIYLLDEEELTATVDVSKGVEGDITIPASIYVGDEEYMVVGIGDKAFRGQKKLTGVSLPRTLRTVYRSAFDGTGLMNDTANWTEQGELFVDSVLIAADRDVLRSKYAVPEGTWLIAVGAFQRCNDLKNIQLPRTLHRISDYTFLGCKALNKIRIHGAIEEIGKGAFRGTAIYENEKKWKKGALYIDTCLIEVNDELAANYQIRPDCRLIANGAFAGAKNLKSVTIPAHIRRIGAETFRGCGALKSITLPDSLRSIGFAAFWECASLKELPLPATVDSLGRSAFSRCNSLQQMRLPEGIRNLPDGAFYECVALSEVVMPAELERIGVGAFNGCVGLLEAKIPATVKQIGAGAFMNCRSLSEATVPAGVYEVEPHTFRYCSKLSHITLPDDLYAIGRFAFQGCISLEKMTMPKHLQRVGQYAFQGCQRMETLQFSDYTETLEEGAFADCVMIRRVDIPIRTKVVPKYCFKGCKQLEGVTVPSDLKQIEEEAFSGCVRLRRVILPEDTQLGKNAFLDCKKLQLTRANAQ